MAPKIALCAGALYCEQPQLIGLDGEVLSSQSWLKLYREGREARDEISRDSDIEEAWVVSSDDVDAINLAAALKADRPQLKVRLLDYEGGGSILSRAHTASIDEVLGKRAFVERYLSAKREAAGPDNIPEAFKSDHVPDEGAMQSTLAISPVHENMRQDGQKAAGCFVIPVVSGSGGSGKSAIAVLSALIARSMGKHVLLLDYDLQFGDAAMLLGVEKPLTIDEALRRPDKLDLEAERTDRLALLAAPERLEVAEDVAHMVPELLNRVEDSFDVVIANTGSAWAEQHASLLERSTATLFLIDQRSSSVRACRHALELCSRCGIATGQFQYVLNRCAKGSPLTSIDVSFALQGAPVAELRDGGRDVEEYLSAGEAADLLETGNELCLSLAQVIANLLPSGEPGENPAVESSKGKSPGRRLGRHGTKRKGWGK